MPDPRVAHCVFCDDVRQEIGNKLSLMGVYVGELIVPMAPPVVMPKFAIVVWIITDIDDPVMRVTTSVRMPPDGQEVFKAEVGQATTIPSLLEGARKMIAHQILTFGNFLVPAPGMMEVMLETDTGPMRAGRLLIRFEPPVDISPPSTASPLPSEQSPPAAPASKPSRGRRPSTRRAGRTPERE